MGKRIAYIDSLKGLAILLMVMGHVIAHQFPYYQVALNESPRVTMLVWRIIYSFHMPLLMFCSGLFALPSEKYSWSLIGQTVWKRVLSLLIPYFSAGAIYYMINGSNYWFLWMLFQFIIISLIIDSLCSFIPKYSKTFSSLFIILLAIFVHVNIHRFYFLEYKPLLDIDHWKQYPFFCMGVICARYDLCTKWFSINWVYTCSLLVFGFLTYWVTIKGNHIPCMSITWCVVPISAIVALVYLFKEGLANINTCGLKWLQDVGSHSLEIYILHVFFLFEMHTIGEYVLKVANADGGGRTIFFVQITTSFVASVIIIALCYIVMNVINKSNILSQLLLGRKNSLSV